MFSALGIPYNAFNIGVLVAPGAAILEYQSKKIDEKKYPVIRTIVEVFSKTMQEITYFFAPFFMLRPYVKTPIQLALHFTLNAPSLIPIVNGVVQHYGNEAWKKNLSLLELRLMAICKLYNTIAATSMAYDVRGLLGATVVGVSVGTIMLATL